MSSTGEKFLVGIFDDEDILLHGVEGIREKGVKIHEVYTPFPFTAWMKYWVISVRVYLLQLSCSV
jgi:hypothetical protein